MPQQLVIDVANRHNRAARRSTVELALKTIRQRRFFGRLHTSSGWIVSAWDERRSLSRVFSHKLTAFQLQQAGIGIFIDANHPLNLSGMWVAVWHWGGVGNFSYDEFSMHRYNFPSFPPVRKNKIWPAHSPCKRYLFCGWPLRKRHTFHVIIFYIFHFPPTGPVCGAFKSSDVEYLAIDTGVAYARWYLQQEEQRGRLARAIVLTDCQSAAKSAAIDVDDERIRVQWVRRRFVSGADTYARSASARPALDTGLHFPNLQLYCPS